MNSLPKSSPALRRSLLAAGLLSLLGACGPSQAPADVVSVDSALDGAAGRCAVNADCDDLVFCNGLERCMPSAPGADVRGCVRASGACGAGTRCVESSRMCVPDTTGSDAGPDVAGEASTEASCDMDGDGHASRACGGDDCDDAQPAVHPGAMEVCNNSVDDDCDGTVDVGAPLTLYRDLDHDGEGDASGSAGSTMSTNSCATPSLGWVRSHGDCDDTRQETYPGAREQCDGRDNDCSLAGAMAGGADPSEDMDGDMHSPVGATCLGRGQTGAVATAFPKDDCDDTSPTRYTGAMEICGNGIDDDCDGVVDNSTQRVCNDVDRDGHGDPSTMRAVMSCTLPAGTVTLCDDCDDNAATGAARYPGNREVCDRVDNDCSTPGSAVALEEDTDNDRYAPLTATCVGLGEAGAPATAFPRTDCDDANAAVHPGAAESCDRVDSDCSSGGGVAASEDMDMDGWAPTAAACLARGEAGASSTALPRGDCDDTRAAVNPGVTENLSVCDGLDNDCNPATSELTRPCGTGQVCAPGGMCAAGSRVAEVAVGFNHTCARRNDGSVACWGYNIYGQLGDGTVVQRVLPVAVAGVSNAVELVSGDHHVCARRNDGTVLCWGRNRYGQLGDSTTTDRGTAALVPGLTGVAQLAAGFGHTCARRGDGSYACWGYNLYGQLGDGTMVNHAAPISVSAASNVVEVQAGGSRTCARALNGTLQCFGRNDLGQLGDGTAINRSLPVSVLGLSAVARVFAGGSHTCALLNDGSGRCWGDNTFGQLGDNTMTTRTTPTPVMMLAGAVELAVGENQSCARRSDGAILCWGSNTAGQLGDGTMTNRGVPTLVPGLANVVQLDAGGDHTCARQSSGAVLCWGANTYGQVGDGTSLNNRPTPVVVSGL